MTLPVLAVCLLAGCGGRHAPDRCPGARLTAAQGTAMSEETGQHTLLVEIVDRGAPCTVEGVPRVELLDGAGKELRFSYTHAGDQMVPPAHPRPVRLSIGHSGMVELNKYRCDIRDEAVARTIRLTLSHAVTLTLSLAQQPVLDWCPGEKPSTSIDVSAVYAKAPPGG